MREDIYFDSSGSGKIHACIWSAEAPIAVVQIVHGIAEHVLRYDDFAEYLVGRGYAVVAEDHMGHGTSKSESGYIGYFHGGWSAAVKDVLSLTEIIKARFGNIPYFLFGHSMGSFLVRTIIADYSQLAISGCVICGTGWQSPALLSVAVPISKIISRVCGEHKPSNLLHKMAFGSYNNRIEHKRTSNDWLTRDDRIVELYEEDALCGFVPSAGLMRDMLMGIRYIQQHDTLMKMNKQLPCYFIAGGDDPVGDYGAGVRKAMQAFQDVGMQNVSCKIYSLCRHEILNEINRQEVYEDTAAWLDNLI